MSVVLRHAASGYYYAGPSHWVADPKLALDLGTIEDAIEESRRVEFRLEVVAGFGEPDCEWVLPVRGGGCMLQQTGALSVLLK